MPKLTEEEKAKLEEETIWCKENLKFLHRKLNRIIEMNNDCQMEIAIWKERFEKADREIAFATKLTVYTGERKKEGILKSLEKILDDKDKLKQFIKLLEDEGGDLNS
jgi:hypothetical protein